MKKKKNKEVPSTYQVEAAPKKSAIPTNGPIASRGMHEVIGVGRPKRYDTNDVETYRAYIGNLTEYQVQSECVRVGLQPQIDASRARDRLIREFNSFHESSKPLPAPVQIRISEKGQQILDRMKGRSA